MKILVTGRGTGGSWAIRGAQIGVAIGAAVFPKALEVAKYDLAVLVKRPEPDLLERLHRARVPIVWDIVDAWPQPTGNEWSRARCLDWLRESVQMIMPVGIVAATQAMAEDCRRFSVPVLALPHHARPRQRVNPIRPINVVGYEGGKQYLGHWVPAIKRECTERGWQFVVNPTELADVDIVLALRDCRGYAPRNWKSNVKLANAQGSGTPVICNREAGYIETASGAEQWADTAEELSAAFDALTPMGIRREAAERLYEATPGLDSVATDYLQWLRSNF